MWSLRSLVAVSLLLTMATLAACGGSPGGGGATSSPGGGDQSSEAEPTEAGASESAAESTGGGPAGSLDDLINALTPPNSSQISKTTAEGGAFVAWETSDSFDSLKSFYEGAIGAAGMQIYSRSEAGGTYSWVFAESEGSSHGGSVTLGPASDGGPGSNVILAITE
ncbi:MAG TPA: hypothetical protein VFK61_01865 [Candidatus Limnocylindria bacterium]|jgi:hypothetical protein|nr:hypothetical protein [Candidatus Limnocylindria bacterium]